ncbi:MAG: carboxypeptidase-like regulatory domain-containing protein [Pyrinomonadaceae bacterium]
MNIVLIGLLVFGGSILTIAQSITSLSTLSGTVYDINKAVVVGTEIVVTGSDGKVTKTKANEDGRYSIALDSGHYTAQFTLQGFKISKYVNIDISASEKKSLDVVLEVRSCDDCEGFIIPEDGSKDNLLTSLLTGTICDKRGGLIYGVSVTAKDGKKREFKTTTDENGMYQLTLPKGSYSINVRAEGFIPVVITNFVNLGEEENKIDLEGLIGKCDDCHGAIYGADISWQNNPRKIDYRKQKDKTKIKIKERKD